jgi:putative transposase
VCCVNYAHPSSILDCLVLIKGAPLFITTDNGPEFSGKALDKWAYNHYVYFEAYNNNVTLDFIEPGKPIQNAFIESFNGRLKHECLNRHYFETLQEVKKIVENWRIEYNTFRSHGSLKGLTPEEFTRIWKEEKQQKTLDS